MADMPDKDIKNTVKKSDKDLPPTYAPDPDPAQIELGKPRKQITLSLPTGALNMRRSGVAFVAEYTVMLFMLGIVICNATWLVFVFFELIVKSMQGGAMMAMMPAPLATLWIAATSLVAFPLLAILWRRTQGELAENKEYTQGIPRGWARAFRTFWLVLVALSAFMLLAVGIYAPLATMQDKTPFGDALLLMTIPAIIGTAILGSGMYIATRNATDRKLSRLILLVLAIGSAVLIVVNYLWSTNLPATNKKSPGIEERTPRTMPSTPYDDPYRPSSPYEAY